MHIYRSSTISIPTNLNLTELLHSNARPGLPSSHLIAKDNLTDRSITIGELRRRAGRIAHGLQLRYAPADQSAWAIIIPNSVEFVEVFHAVLWTGGIVCPINHALKANEIAHALTVSKPEYVIAFGDVVSKVEDAITSAQAIAASQGTKWRVKKLITVISRSSGLPHIPDDFLESEALPIPHHSDTRTRVASIHLSSGTTGYPKGVELTHYNFVANCYQLYAHDPEQFGPDSRTVAFTPFAHIAMTTMPIFLGPWTGMFHHAMPSYNQEEFGGLVGSNQATSFQGVPSIVLQMANSDLTTKYDFSKAKVINVGGPRLTAEVKARLLGRAPWKLNECYGMTEASGYVAYQKYGEDLPPNTVGHLLPNVEAVLKKEGSTDDAPPGGPGELWLRGPNITRGYVSNPTATKDAFPMAGWFNTGDVCTFDSQGRLSIVGRTKELIKYKGFQVAPAELESYINGHEAVRECAVGVIWDESQLTELPAAWVILKDHIMQKGETTQHAALRHVHQSVDSQVSGYKKLRGGVWLVQALPRNATGKILRKQLVQLCTGPCSLDQSERVSKL